MGHPCHIMIGEYVTGFPEQSLGLLKGMREISMYLDQSLERYQIESYVPHGLIDRR
jgi:hypothetical protein